jgi:hypothetical protein
VASSPDPGRPEIPYIKTPTFKNAPRPILGQLNDRPVAMKLDQPAAIDGPQQTRTTGTVERTVAAPAEQGYGVPAQCGGALGPRPRGAAHSKMRPEPFFATLAQATS